jgi:hypothetical protein
MSTGALLAARRFEGFVNRISGLRRKMLDRTTCHEPCTQQNLIGKEGGQRVTLLRRRAPQASAKRRTKWAWWTVRSRSSQARPAASETRTVDVLIEEGARVVFTGRRAEEGQTIADRLGPNAVFVQADATSESDWRRVGETTMERFGRIDCLYNSSHANSRVFRTLGSGRGTLIS